MGEKYVQFDLEDRTYEFARRCRDFTKIISKIQANIEYGKQLIRSSGSTAANYIEANEAISDKDFIFRIRICRKEVKESRLWLKLSDPGEEERVQSEQVFLIGEATELLKIFTAIINKKSESKKD